jgi:hypothetical protein
MDDPKKGAKYSTFLVMLLPLFFNTEPSSGQSIPRAGNAKMATFLPRKTALTPLYWPQFQTNAIYGTRHCAANWDRMENTANCDETAICVTFKLGNCTQMQNYAVRDVQQHLLGELGSHFSKETHFKHRHRHRHKIKGRKAWSTR